MSYFFCQNKKKKKNLQKSFLKNEIAKVDKICIFSGEVRKHRSLRRDSVSGQHINREGKGLKQKEELVGSQRPQAIGFQGEGCALQKEERTPEVLRPKLDF